MSLALYQVGTTDLILEAAVKRLGDGVDDVVVIENVLVIDQKRIKQEIILILMPETLDLLFERLFKELK